MTRWIDKPVSQAVAGTTLFILAMGAAQGETLHCPHRLGVGFDSMGMVVDAYKPDSRIVSCNYSDQQSQEFDRARDCNLAPVTDSQEAFPKFYELCKARSGSTDECTVTCGAKP